MRLGLQSFSPKVSDQDLAALVPILNKQQEHYATLWETEPIPVSLDQGPDMTMIYILDHALQPGALGDHLTDSQGRPYGRIYMDVAQDWRVTVSHEMLEICGDPYINWWVEMPDGTFDALELCDRCEGDTYLIDGVAVSNFLGPRAFGNGPGPYDYMGLLTSPFEIRPGGYAIRRSKDGTTSSVFGSARVQGPSERGSKRVYPGHP